jgi:hypothetical protein
VIDPTINGSIDYVPTYEGPLIFRWRGYWVEIASNNGQTSVNSVGMRIISITFVSRVFLGLGEH